MTLEEIEEIEAHAETVDEAPPPPRRRRTPTARNTAAESVTEPPAGATVRVTKTWAENAPTTPAPNAADFVPEFSDETDETDDYAADPLAYFLDNLPPNAYRVYIFRHRDPIHLRGQYARPSDGELITDRLIFVAESFLDEVRYMNGNSGGRFRFVFRDLQTGELIGRIEDYALSNPPANLAHPTSIQQPDAAKSKIEMLRELAEEKKLLVELGMVDEKRGSLADDFIRDSGILTTALSSVMASSAQMQTEIMKQALAAARPAEFSWSGLAAKVGDKFVSSEPAQQAISALMEAGGKAAINYFTGQKRAAPVVRPVTPKPPDAPQPPQTPAATASEVNAIEADIIDPPQPAAQPTELDMMTVLRSVIRAIATHAALNDAIEETELPALVTAIRESEHAELLDTLAAGTLDEAKAALRQGASFCMMRGKIDAVLTMSHADAWLTKFMDYLRQE